jgi:hypothetical protein
MSDHAAGKLIFPKIVLYLYIALAALFVFGLAGTTKARAQSPAARTTQDIADRWQGTLHAGRDLRTVVKISRAHDGEN